LKERVDFIIFKYNNPIYFECFIFSPIFKRGQQQGPKTLGPQKYILVEASRSRTQNNVAFFSWAYREDILR
jgi:hypothetical protein